METLSDTETNMRKASLICRYLGTDWMYNIQVTQWDVRIQGYFNQRVADAIAKHLNLDHNDGNVFRYSCGNILIVMT